MILQLHKSRPSPEVCRIELVGKLMMGNESRQVEWTIAELLLAGVKKVVFDLKPATHEDEKALHEHAQVQAIGHGAAG